MCETPTHPGPTAENLSQNCIMTKKESESEQANKKLKETKKNTNREGKKEPRDKHKEKLHTRSLLI